MPKAAKIIPFIPSSPESETANTSQFKVVVSEESGEEEKKPYPPDSRAALLIESSCPYGWAFSPANG